jgi:hypothetical protein
MDEACGDEAISSEDIQRRVCGPCEDKRVPGHDVTTENGLGLCTQVCCGAQADDSFSALAASKFHSDAGLSGF